MDVVERRGGRRRQWRRRARRDRAIGCHGGVRMREEVVELGFGSDKGERPKSSKRTREGEKGRGRGFGSGKKTSNLIN